MTSLRMRFLVVAACGALVLLTGGPAWAQQAFSDDPLVAGVTPIRAVHIMELRARIDALRQLAAVGPFAWTDPAIIAGVTTVRAVHLQELRNALTGAAS